MQGAGSVASGVALHACAEGARLSIADVDEAKAKKLADATGGKVVPTDEMLGLEADVISPNALGAILDEPTIAALKTPVVAGGANNQLATPEDGERLHERGILYAPDYVINAGGIINVCTEYLTTATPAWSGAGSKASRCGSSRSGRKARRPGRDPPPSPTRWRSG